MKISNEIPSVYAKQGVAPGKAAEKPAESQPAAAPGADRVNLSAKARELQAAQQMVRRMPDVDIEKVNKIKTRLKEGTYNVDANSIAANILAESLINRNG